MSEQEKLEKITQAATKAFQAVMMSQQSGSTSKDHKTLIEMLDCPDCGKGFVDALKERLKEPEPEKPKGKPCPDGSCKGIGKEEDTECPECGEYY